MKQHLVLAVLAYIQAHTVEAQGGSKGRPIKYTCPEHGGMHYTTPEPNVVTFELKCDQGTTAGRIDNSQQESQKACANHCSEHPNCQSADYSWDTKNCARFSEYIPTIGMVGVNTWFPLERREQNIERPEPEPARTDTCPAPHNLIVETVADTATFTSDSSCPNGEGKIFVTSNGTYMKTRCVAHSAGGDPIATGPRSSMNECLNYCADTPGCTRAVWTNVGSFTCQLFTGGESDLTQCGNTYHDGAWVIEPPTIEAADDPLILCSTECPGADGQTWDSPTGERFHMDCCKRHGVSVFAQEQMPSLKACMAACGTAPACQSVDYHESSGMCLFGKHSGEPTISVAGWSSAHSMGCAGACTESGTCCGGFEQEL